MDGTKVEPSAPTLQRMPSLADISKRFEGGAHSRRGSFAPSDGGRPTVEPGAGMARMPSLSDLGRRYSTQTDASASSVPPSRTVSTSAESTSTDATDVTSLPLPSKPGADEDATPRVDSFGHAKPAPTKFEARRPDLSLAPASPHNPLLGHGPPPISPRRPMLPMGHGPPPMSPHRICSMGPPPMPLSPHRPPMGQFGAPPPPPFHRAVSMPTSPLSPMPPGRQLQNGDKFPLEHTWCVGRARSES